MPDVGPGLEEQAPCRISGHRLYTNGGAGVEFTFTEHNHMPSMGLSPHSHKHLVMLVLFLPHFTDEVK